MLKFSYKFLFYFRWKESRAVLNPGLTSSRLRILKEIVKPVYNNLKNYLDRNPNDIEVSIHLKLFVTLSTDKSILIL